MIIAEMAAGFDTRAKLDQYMKKARHMMSFGSAKSEIREALVADGAREDEAYLSYMAAFLLVDWKD